ncbi:Phytoene desaturase, neurosporene or lycopene producing [Rubellimicrobium mesophilum DSM 19309]|uniref:Phytoene desaturase, neurosporene or lycopene producing n=1 Tax=Rubellimicrobium mesophilum DSM 19309 TaxID=442562 RepID=A0A017HRK1_9RHOB|nr:phytoene desaturase family protein [Rubellimicrobium mesophilum]EYD76950.1 Phytoene desaturase, neurosporene or lycopene producing [Rubellimicrobium mesophilum DSM 19309]
MRPGRRTPGGRKVVVIGAGPGGLAAAMLARAAGAEVTVLERGDRVGGRTASIEQDGYVFDTGPTFFLYPEVLREVFAATGRDLEAEVPMVRLDPMYRLLFEGGGSFDASADMDRLKAEVARIDPADAAGVEPYFADNLRKFEAFKPILQKPFLNLGAFADPAMVRSLPLLRPFATVDQDLSRWFRNPLVRLAFSFQSKYLGMSPFKCPSLFTILAHIEYAHGVWHPLGGCNAIPKAMARVLGDMGVDIRLSEPVEEMLFEGRRATGVRTDRATYAADAVVVNADFAHAMRRMVPNRLRRRWTDERIDAKSFSCSTFMLYLGLDTRIEGLAHHTIGLSRDYDRNIREIEEGLAPSDPSLYVQNASVTDPSLAPPGHSALYVLVPVGNLSGGTDWTTLAPAYRELTLDRLARFVGRDLRPHIRTERMLTPRDWEAMGIHLGATFNLSHNLGQMLHNRPHNRFEDLDGVYLTGGGTHPGSGLPTIFESARISARLLARDLGLDASAVPRGAMAEAAE